MGRTLCLRSIFLYPDPCIIDRNFELTCLLNYVVDQFLSLMIVSGYYYVKN